MAAKRQATISSCFRLVDESSDAATCSQPRTYLEAAGVLEDGVFDAERVHLPRSVLLRLRPDCEPEDEQGKMERRIQLIFFSDNSLSFVMFPESF